MKLRRANVAPDGTELESILRKATHDLAWWPAFYRTLLKSEVLALVPKQPVANNERGEEVIRFIQWKRIDGSHAIPLFTSARTLYEAIPEGAECLVIDVPRLLLLTRGALLHLNPFSEFNVHVTPKEIESLLADGALVVPTPFRPDSSRQLMFRKVTDPPAATIDSLMSLYRQSVIVEAAYLAEVEGLYGPNQPSLLLGLEFEGDAETVIRDTGLVIADTYAGSLPLDIARIGERMQTPKAWFSSSLCIYQRSRGTQAPPSDVTH